MSKDNNLTDRYKLVLIEWEDSVLGFQGWKQINENINEVTIFHSVGFLILKDKKKIVIFPHIDKNKGKEGSGTGDIVIPVSAIKKITYLKY